MERRLHSTIQEKDAKNERGATGNGSPGPPVLSRWLAWVLLYFFIEVVMNSLIEGAFTSVYFPGSTPHPLPKAVIPC
jgi:hypothetical protein